MVPSRQYVVKGSAHGFQALVNVVLAGRDVVQVDQDASFNKSMQRCTALASNRRPRAFK